MPNQITQEEFDKHLAEILSKMSTAELLAIPGLYEVVSEDLNNAVIKHWEEEEGR